MPPVIAGTLLERVSHGPRPSRVRGSPMMIRIVKAAGFPRHISPHSLLHAEISNALDAGVLA